MNKRLEQYEELQLLATNALALMKTKGLGDYFDTRALASAISELDQEAGNINEQPAEQDDDTCAACGNQKPYPDCCTCGYNNLPAVKPEDRLTYLRDGYRARIIRLENELTEEREKRAELLQVLSFMRSLDGNGSLSADVQWDAKIKADILDKFLHGASDDQSG